MKCQRVSGFIRCNRLPLNPRNPQETRASPNSGHQTHRSSDHKTPSPTGERKRLRLSGAAGMTGKWAKNRSSDHGQRKATPSPPLVKASRTLCDIAAAKRKSKTHRKVLWSCRNKHAPSKATTEANRMEWLNPRCPNSAAYGTPKRNATTSRSGSTETTTPASKSLPGMALRPSPSARARGTAGCVMMVGTASISRQDLEGARPYAGCLRNESIGSGPLRHFGLRH